MLLFDRRQNDNHTVTLITNQIINTVEETSPLMTKKLPYIIVVTVTQLRNQSDPWAQNSFHHLMAMLPWAKLFNFVNLSFIIYKMRVLLYFPDPNYNVLEKNRCKYFLKWGWTWQLMLRKTEQPWSREIISVSMWKLSCEKILLYLITHLRWVIYTGGNVLTWTLT